LIRRARVSGCLAEVIQWIQSLRAMGVMSDHNDELEISACARSEFEACLEQETI
jgi:hypothetical protein